MVFELTTTLVDKVVNLVDVGVAVFVVYVLADFVKSKVKPSK
jgi:hypothetical protein